MTIDNSTTKSILIVDDEEYIRIGLSQLLENSGFRVETAHNGTIAKTKLDYAPFDLVLTDILMASGDGLDLILYVVDRYPEARTIAMSGGGKSKKETLLAIAKKCGADQTIKKPFTNEQLLHLIGNVLANDFSPVNSTDTVA